MRSISLCAAVFVGMLKSCKRAVASTGYETRTFLAFPLRSSSLRGRPWEVNISACRGIQRLQAGLLNFYFYISSRPRGGAARQGRVALYINSIGVKLVLSAAQGGAKSV